jgi:alcohol dehydrogenase (cytochrome c)
LIMSSNFRKSFIEFSLVAVILIVASLSARLLPSEIFAQEPTSIPSSSNNPKLNETLPTELPYNKAARNYLESLSMPQNLTLPSTNQTDTGLEPEHQNDWITANHDIYYTRNSPQTIIGRDNVNQLQVRWVFLDKNPIQNPPLIIGDRAYAEDNKARIMAFDLNTGLNLWTVDMHGDGTFHGMTYDQGIIFAPTGDQSTIVAINATNGKVVWQSKPLAPDSIGYQVVNPPIVWKDYVIAGSAGGDEPTELGLVQGNITALNRTDGQILWNFRTTVGDWVAPGKSPPNGGATTWSGGSFDPGTGTLYIPAGNASPDFNATGLRPSPNLYVNNMLAINITTGKLVWATPFIANGTVVSDVKEPDTHDWDASWGSTLSSVTLDNGTRENLVIGTDKRGDVMAMDAATGKPIWWRTIGTVYNTHATPTVNGSGEVWPGTQGGVEDYHAVDNNTAFFATSSMGFNYFVNSTKPELGYEVPAINSIANGVGNGTITAIDLRTGAIKWQDKTEFPTYVSPLVTNGLVFTGEQTPLGKPYTVNAFGAPISGPLIPSGIIMALDKDTGKTLWEFNVGAPVGIGGPSIGQGMLLVTVTNPSETLANQVGGIFAFGLSQQNSPVSIPLPLNVTAGTVSNFTAAGLPNSTSASQTATSSLRSSSNSTNAAQPTANSTAYNLAPPHNATNIQATETPSLSVAGGDSPGTIKVTGSGFTPNTNVTVAINANIESPAWVTATSKGTFASTLPVPKDAVSGSTLNVVATDVTGAQASATYEIH